MSTTSTLAQHKRKAFGRFFIGFIVLALVFFLSAGTIFYWQAWVYLSVLFLPVFGCLCWLLKHAPDLLERRMRMREKEKPQKVILFVSTLLLVMAFVLPGLDRRFGWSSLSPIVVIGADLLVLLGYALFVRVLQTNRYASRIIEVEQDQTVISMGPYALVRHPMYSAILLLYMSSPLALGSYVALIPMAALPFLLMVRIRNEEEVLVRELKGYDAYLQQTKYRLIPGVW